MSLSCTQAQVPSLCLETLAWWEGFTQVNTLGKQDCIKITFLHAITKLCNSNNVTLGSSTLHHHFTTIIANNNNDQENKQNKDHIDMQSNLSKEDVLTWIKSVYYVLSTSQSTSTHNTIECFINVCI